MLRRPLRRTGAAVVLLALVSAGAVGCGGDDDSDTATTASSTVHELRAPEGTDALTLDTAAGVVRRRIAAQELDATVTTEDGALVIEGEVDPYQLRALAQPTATVISVVHRSIVGPCRDIVTGVPSFGAATRCYQLGAEVTGTDAITSATANVGEGVGWQVDFEIGDQYQEFRAAITGTDATTLAVVADGTVLVEFQPGLPALSSTIGPQLDEEQARATAAALLVPNILLGVALEAPPLPEPGGPDVGEDFWTAALGVQVCGEWLPNAPTTNADQGLHSHGDGLVYLHPDEADEAGDQATLGRWLENGDWSADESSLRLWDGTEHRNGDDCAGTPSEVHWWVDGVAQEGDPSAWRPRNNQVIVLAFAADPDDAPIPPQADALALPSLSARPT